MSAPSNCPYVNFRMNVNLALRKKGIYQTEVARAIKDITGTTSTEDNVRRTVQRTLAIYKEGKRNTRKISLEDASVFSQILGIPVEILAFRKHQEFKELFNAEMEIQEEYMGKPSQDKSRYTWG